MKLLNLLEHRAKNRTNKTEVILTCKDCREQFPITVGELCWYHEVGNLIPTRCKNCRKKNKTKKQKIKTAENNAEQK